SGQPHLQRPRHVGVVLDDENADAPPFRGRDGPQDAKKPFHLLVESFVDRALDDRGSGAYLGQAISPCRTAQGVRKPPDCRGSVRRLFAQPLACRLQRPDARGKPLTIASLEIVHGADFDRTGSPRTKCSLAGFPVLFRKTGLGGMAKGLRSRLPGRAVTARSAEPAQSSKLI